MKGMFFKGIILGAVTSTLVLTASVALAGSGVGGVFNLGVPNDVNATTNLHGTTAGPQLQVNNASGAAGAYAIAANGSSTTPAISGGNTVGAGLRGVSTNNAGALGLSTNGIGTEGRTASASNPALRGINTGGGPAAAFIVNAGVTPFTVSSSTLVSGLNSDQLDGRSLPFNGGDIEDESLTAADLAPNSVGSSEIQTDAVNATEIADDSIDSGEIVDFGLSNQDIGVLFAQVNADGTVFNSSGGVTVVKIGTGTYEVDFGRNITSCASVVTQGEGGVGGAAGAITGVTDRSGNAEATFTTIRTDANVLVDRAFQQIVVC
jgi:hypothetical protein